MKLGELVRIRTGRLDANQAVENGRYPFFTCAAEPLRIDAWQYDCECVLVAGNCNPYVSYYNGKFNAYQRVYIIEVEAVDRLCAKYLYYFLKLYMKRSTDRQHGAIEKFFHLSDFTDIEVNFPSVEEQRLVADSLWAIDRKIALNRKRIATLEAMAKEVYDYWFVQFDFPDAHGRPYKSSGGAMVYNPDLKREIPRGWEVGRLADIAQYSKETVRSDAIDIKHYVTTDSLLQGKKGRVQAANLPPVPVSLVAFQKDDTLVANIRPYLKKIWYASESGGSSQDVLVFHPICSELSPLLHSILWQDDFFDYVMAAAKGSKMPRGDKAHIMDYPIPLPDKKVARRFGESVEKFYAWCECALKETESLISLRDFLLPVLMNGQVKVR